MKKLVILSLLIQASIVCSSSSEEDFTYNGPQIATELIDKTTGKITSENFNAIYNGCCFKENCYGSLVKEKMAELFALGKRYATDNLNSKLTNLTTQNTNLQKQSLIKFLNSYSTPAKIGFGFAGAIVAASLVYSGRQLYLFSKQKYSDWKAKKEESELLI